MPFEAVKQLPVTIRDTLPDQAQEIYRKAYNQAWEEYDKEDHRGLNQQGLAHQRGWTAVQHEYVFDLGQWHRKGETVKKEESKGIFGKVKSLFSR